MYRLVLSLAVIFGVVGARAQPTRSKKMTKMAARRQPGKQVPECGAGAICFSGEVRPEQEFRKQLSPELDFVLVPGWTINVVQRKPEAQCDDLSWILTWPIREHNQRYINMDYGWTAEDEVRTSPREFRFVTSCADFRTELDRYEKNDLEKLGTSVHGEGRLWITDSKVSHPPTKDPDDKAGRIDWMKFSVEIHLLTGH